METPTGNLPVAIAGEEHTLGLSLAELCLLELGWTPIWLGARTPTEDLLRMVERSGARIVAMSASAASNDAGLLGEVAAEVVAVGHSNKVEVVLGGEGAWPDAPPHGLRLRSFTSFHKHLAGIADDRRANARSGG